jgi:hypothetical protein
VTSGDSYVIQQYLFNISKQTTICIVPVDCEALEEKLKDCTQVKQIFVFVFVVSEKLKKYIYFYKNFYLNTNVTQTLSLKTTEQIILKLLVY